MTQREWPQEHMDALREIMADPRIHYSFTEVAAVMNDRLGTSYSRNAVLGKASRSGLFSGNGKGCRSGNKQKREPRAAATAKPDAPKRSAAAVGPKLKCDEVMTLSAGNIETLNISLLELEKGKCHWPVDGDMAVVYCGRGAIEGSSWCPAHFRMAHSDRREARAC
jgi:GcrA cell cycle regulator